MSVVAVKVLKTKIKIAADSVEVTGSIQRKDKLAKLNKINNMIIGSIGSSQETTSFEIYLKSRQPQRAEELAVFEFMADFRDWYSKKIGKADTPLKSSYILIFKGKAFLISDQFIREIKKYYAIGAGMSYALSALYLKRGVKTAVKVACELSIYCEEPINYMEVKI